MKDKEIVGLSNEVVALSSAVMSAAATSESLKESLKAIGGAVPAVNIATAALALVSIIMDILDKLQDRAEANAISKRWLAGLETAKGLAPESVRIVAAVQEIVQNAFEKHEQRSVEADNHVTADFLRTEIMPLAQDLYRRTDKNVKEAKTKLYSRMEVQQKNLYLHRSKARDGIQSMGCGRGNYQAETNHILHFAAAARLRAGMQFYHILFASRLTDESLLDYVQAMKDDTEKNSDEMKKLFLEYTKNRYEMVNTNYRYE